MIVDRSDFTFINFIFFIKKKNTNKQFVKVTQFSVVQVLFAGHICSEYFYLVFSFYLFLV